MFIKCLNFINQYYVNLIEFFRCEEDSKLLSNGLTSKQPNLQRVRLSNTETMSEKSSR